MREKINERNERKEQKERKERKERKKHPPGGYVLVTTSSMRSNHDPEF